MILAGCADVDGDGFRGGADCDDTEPTVHKGGIEVCDGLDNDCDGNVDEDVAITAFQDRDGDGFGDPDRVRRVCTLPPDGVLEAGDCNDLSATSYPGAPEVCDGLDNNCDGEVDEGVQLTFYEDLDGDGHGTTADTAEACIPPVGFASAADDCDDQNALAWSEAPELCDGEDNDCDGDIDEDLPLQALFADLDGDGYGDASSIVPACGPGAGVSDRGDDCDDGDALIHPDAPEVSGNGANEDCDGYIDEIAVPDHAATIEDALSLASPGDVVQLDQGPWFGNVDLTGTDITFAGEGCGQTVLFGEPGGPTVRATAGLIEGMTLTTGGESGLRIEGDVVARHLCVEGNASSTFGGGIDVAGGATFVLEDARVADNYAALNGGGISAYPEALVELTRVEFLRNEAAYDGGAIDVRSANLVGEALLFVDNEAQIDGGAIDVSKGPLSDVLPVASFSHVTVVGSRVLGSLFDPFSETVDGAAVRINQGSLLMDHALFMDNDQPWEAVVSVGDEAQLTLEYAAMLGINDGDVDGRYLPFVLREPAQFLWEDAATGIGDYRLRPDSPYRDAGSVSRPDPDGSPADLGAYGGPNTWAGFDPMAEDADADGLPDAWEVLTGGPTWRDDATEDPDGDGLTNIEEFQANSHPLLPDSDGDGASDGEESNEGTDPTQAGDRAPVSWFPVEDVLVGDTVTLPGDWSFDPQGEALTYSWVVLGPNGSSGGLSSATAPTPQLTASTSGFWTVQLTVDDGAQSHEVLDGFTAWDAVVVPDDAATLEEAVTLALAGNGVVALRPGVWDADIDVTGQALTLIGLGKAEEVVLDAGPSGRLLTADDALIEVAHVTLRHGASTDGGAIWGQGSEFLLRDVRLEDNSALDDGGAVWLRNSTFVANDVQVVDSSSGARGGAIYAESSAVTWERGRLSGNSASVGGALYVDNGGTAGADDAVVLRNVTLQANAAASASVAWMNLSEDRTNLWEQSVFVGHGGTDAAVQIEGAMLVVAPWIVGDTSSASFAPSAQGTRLDLIRPVVTGGTAPVSVPSLIPVETQTLAAVPLWDAVGYRNDLWTLEADAALLGVGWPRARDLDGGASSVGVAGGSYASRLAQLDRLDLDADGLPDGWERRFGLDPQVDDALGDADGDTVSNLDEFVQGTRPDGY